MNKWSTNGGLVGSNSVCGSEAAGLLCDRHEPWSHVSILSFACANLEIVDSVTPVDHRHNGILTAGWQPHCRRLVWYLVHLVV